MVRWKCMAVIHFSRGTHKKNHPADEKKRPPNNAPCLLTETRHPPPHQKPRQSASRKLCLASGGYEPQQTRPWLGLVCLSRTPSGTFFFFGRSTFPWKWGSNIGKIDFPGPGVCDLAPKARKTFFLRKLGVRERIFFVYHRPQGIYAGLTSKFQREQTTGTPPFCFPSVISPT